MIENYISRIRTIIEGTEPKYLKQTLINAETIIFLNSNDVSQPAEEEVIVDEQQGDGSVIGGDTSA